MKNNRKLIPLNIQKFSEEIEAGTTIQINGSATLTDVDTTKESRVLRLLGQTSQNGTPTPDSPIPVNVVSGDNEINICGKNLLPNAWTTGSISGSTGQPVPFDSRIYTTNKIKVQPSTSYTIHNHNTSTYNITNIIDGYDKNGAYIGRIGQFNGNANGYVLTTQATCEYINITLNNTSNSMTYALFQTYLSDGSLQPQLEAGSTATTYEPYIGKSYPLYLGVENLLDTQGNLVQSHNGINYTYNNNGSFTMNGTATSTYSNSFNIINGIINQNETYTLSVSGTRNFSIGFRLFYSDNSSQDFNIGTSSSYVNIIPTKTPTSFRVYIYGMTTGNSYNATLFLQLEKGSKVNSFNKYGTTPIELCKIGTYQDYIYKDNGSWYLHKEIGKVVLDGSEYWTRSTRPYYQTPINDLIINPSSSTIGQVVCNYFEATTPDNIWSKNENGITNQTDGQMLRIRIKDDTYTLNTFKEWLTTHNLIVYYVLATPTNTQIEDTNLIEQLESLSS